MAGLHHGPEIPNKVVAYGIVWNLQTVFFASFFFFVPILLVNDDSQQYVFLC